MEASASPVPYKDRRTGLIIFGILTIGLGVIAVLMTALMFLVRLAPASSAATPPPTTQQLLGIAILYGAIAIAFIWLGIGSVMTRRWARALLLIASTSAFVFGLLTSIAMIFLWPMIAASMDAAQAAGRPALDPAFKVGVMIVMAVTMLFLYVLLPGAWMFFYRSRHVKATCEARDPVVRWTDRCPLPVLAVSLWLALSVVFILVMPFAYHSTIACFGTILTGLSGTMIYVVMAALFAYGAFGFYRLKMPAWWIIFLVMLLWGTSGILTYLRVDMNHLMSAMGYSPRQLNPAIMSMFRPATMVGIAAASFLPMLGYLIYVRKFFRTAVPISTN